MKFKNLFEEENSEEIISRIMNLSSNSQALWGTMTVNQMIDHCIKPLDVATGKLKLKRSLLGVLFGGWAKKKLLEDKDFPRNSPTAPEFRVQTPREFSDAQQSLINAVRSFQKEGENGLTKEKHPFFGPLSTSEWLLLQYKHLDHHLRQFGV